MSFVKYRVKEVAADFGITPKEVSEIIGKFGEKPKSYTQVLNDSELNVVFDYVTQKNQIKSIEQVFAVKPTAPKAEPKAENKPAAPAQGQQAARPQGQNRPQGGNQQAGRPQNNNNQGRPQGQNQQGRPQNQNNQNRQQPQQPVKQAEPERKRERRVVDTSAVQVNTSRFDDVDNLVDQKVQDFQGGKQRIGGGKGAKQQKQQMGKKGNKSRNEEQEKMRRLQMEVARKAPTVVKIPDEITVGELASRMK